MSIFLGAVAILLGTLAGNGIAYLGYRVIFGEWPYSLVRRPRAYFGELGEGVRQLCSRPFWRAVRDYVHPDAVAVRIAAWLGPPQSGEIVGSVARFTTPGNGESPGNPGPLVRREGIEPPTR